MLFVAFLLNDDYEELLTYTLSNLQVARVSMLMHFTVWGDLLIIIII